MSHMSDEEAFRAYIELMFCASIDPEYEKQVEASQSHKEHYDKAKSKIEYLIITAQQYVHSQAWVNCDPQLLESMEQYSRFELREEFKKRKDRGTEGSSDPFEEEVPCAACNKWSSDRVREMYIIRFLGRRHENAIICPGESKLGEGMRLSHDYLIASPVYQMNRGLLTKGRNPRCTEIQVANDTKGPNDNPRGSSRYFQLGYVCCRRIMTFHALLHFRRHCLLYLTRRAKGLVERRGKMSMNALLDDVLSDDAYNRMYRCFRNLLEVARSMQLSRGHEASHAVSRHTALRFRAPQEILLGDEGTDVSSFDGLTDTEDTEDSEDGEDTEEEDSSGGS